METSGSGFTPGPSNLIYTGSSTSLFFPSTNLIVHYFKIRAVDVFNQGSANYSADSATPESSSGVDLTPPDDPDNVEVTTSAGSNGLSSITVTWDAVGSTNLSDYVVRYSVDEVAWQYLNVPAGQEEALIDNLLPSTDYYVQVAAMSYVNVKSDFINADVYPIETAADTSAPSQPAAPSVSVTTLAAQVSHDMTKQGGGDLEADVEYLEIHASVSSGFTPSNSTLRGTIAVAAPGVDVSGVFYFPATDATANLYWKVIAVDRAKNKSAASNQSTGVPGLILNANIGNATITSAKINDLEANKITAGTGIINNLAIKSTLTIDTAGFLQSSNWNGTSTGYRLDTTGLTIFNGSISAAALLLQDSANLMPPAFADFEFNEDYYHTGGTINTVVWSTSGGTVTADILETDKRFGNKCLRISNGAITNPTVHNVIFAPGGFAVDGNGIDLDPGDYIVSFYAKKNGSPNMNMVFGFYTDAAAFVFTSTHSVTSTSWVRYTGVITVPSGVSKVKPYLNVGPQAANTGYDVLIDGIQIERKLTGLTTASNYRPPSKTVIDGGQIITGSIRSSAMSPVATTQPAWSINTAGNMQIGDALIRGSMTVGSTTTPENLVPTQFTSFENTSSYYADGSDLPNTANFSPYSSSVTTGRVQIITDPQFAAQSLRAYDTTLPTSGNGRGVALSALYNNAATNNIQVVAGQTYVVSGYFKNKNGAKNVQVQWAVFSDSGSFVFAGSATNITASTAAFTRVYGTWTAPSGRSNCQIVVWITPISGTNGYDIAIDGVMFEKAGPGQTTPSTYTDVIGELSYVRSGNYVSGVSGWSIDNAGNAEFNDGFFRGALDISTFFNEQAYGTNISNEGAVWRSNIWGSFDYQISGVEPAIKLSGTGFRANQSGGLDVGDPFQVVLRGSPEGGYQLLFDSSDSDRIFLTDANNDLDENFDPIDDFYGYSELRGGRGYERSFAGAAAAGYFKNQNLYYAQNRLQARTPQSMFSEHAAGSWMTTDSSTLSYDFRPFVWNQVDAVSEIHMQPNNIIPDPWDIYDGVIATYNSGSTKNRVTLDSMQSSLGWITAPLPTGTVKGIQGTLLLAGTGDHTVYMSSTDTTYNVTVEPGAEYSMSMAFAFPASLSGKSVRYVMKLSNGTVLTSSSKTIDASGFLGFLGNEFSMGYADVFTIPAGITSCLVGFQVLGGVSGNTTFQFGVGTLMKTRTASGKYENQYSPFLQYPRSHNSHYRAGASIRLTANAQSSTLGSTPGLAEDKMSQVWLYADRQDMIGSDNLSFGVKISPEGIQFGENTEFRPPGGVSIRTTTASVAVNNGATVNLPTTSGSPNTFGIHYSDAPTSVNQSTDWAEAGPTWTTTAPVGLIAQKGGVYMVSVWASAGSAAAGQYLTIENLTTGIRYAIGGLMPPGPTQNAQDLSVSGLVPCSAGDKIGIVYVNFTGNTRTITQYRITMAQII